MSTFVEYCETCRQAKDNALKVAIVAIASQNPGIAQRVFGLDAIKNLVRDTRQVPLSDLEVLKTLKTALEILDPPPAGPVGLKPETPASIAFSTGDPPDDAPAPLSTANPRPEPAREWQNYYDCRIGDFVSVGIMYPYSQPAELPRCITKVGTGRAARHLPLLRFELATGRPGEPVYMRTE